MSSDVLHPQATRTRVRYLVGTTLGATLAVAGVMTFVPPGAATGGEMATPLSMVAPELVTAPQWLRFSFRPQTSHGDPKAESTMVLQVVYRVSAEDRATARRLVVERLDRAADACAANGRAWQFQELLAPGSATRMAAQLVSVVDRELFGQARSNQQLAAEVIHLHVFDASPLQPGPAMTREQVQQSIQAAADEARRVLGEETEHEGETTEEKKDG